MWVINKQSGHTTTVAVRRIRMQFEEVFRDLISFAYTLTVQKEIKIKTQHFIISVFKQWHVCLK